MDTKFFTAVSLVFAFVGLLWVGCGPKYPNCETDEHCKDHNEYCVDKLCRECGTTDHCVAKTNDKCMICSPNYTCVKEQGCCHSDLDCPGGKCWKSEGADTGRCGGECRTDADCPKGKVCKGGRCVEEEVSGCQPGSCGPGKKCQNGVCVWACEFQTIYFDYNEYALTTDARNILGKNVECAKTIGLPIKIEGHCDERGTEEYNLALGQRRANAAKRFLSNRGVNTRLETISYGEEKPVCTESNENCWWRNRRAEFKIIE